MVAASPRIVFCAPCDIGGSTGRNTSWSRSVSLAGSLSARATVGATSAATSAAATSMRRGLRKEPEITRVYDRRSGYETHVRLTTVIAKLEPGGAQLGAL